MFAATGLVLLVAGGYAGYTHMRSNRIDLESQIIMLQEAVDGYRGKLAISESGNESLSSQLDEEMGKTSEFERQFEDVAETVGILDKLSKTDKELLQKYSKVYFLNEHYVPQNLSNIELKYLYSERTPQQIHTSVVPYLESMLEDAEDDGIMIWIHSAYRSFGTQSTLKQGYLVTYGSGANQFSADQGYSEHQLGTTLDFTTSGIGGSYDAFVNTPAYDWLLDNAYKYGFVLSYPENNAYYIYEPWHWRFVGTKLAKYLHDQGKHFYDLDQRKIDEYLVNIFD